MGVSRYRSGGPAAARMAFRAAAALEPAAAPVLRALGVLDHAGGNVRGAEAALWRCRWLDPADTDSARAVARLMLDGGRAGAAARHLETAAAVAPGDPTLAYLQGEAAVRGGERKSAARLFLRAARLDPSDLRVLFRLAVQCANLGEDEAACRAYRAVLVVDPACTEASFNLGNLVWGRSGGLETGLAHYRTAVRARPDFAPAYGGLGSALAGRSRPGEATGVLRRAAALDPAVVQVYVNLSNAVFALGQVDEAARLLEWCIRLAPDDPTAFSNLLFTLCFKEDVDGQRLLERHRAFDERFGRPLAALARPFGNRPDPERRLRIGIVAPGFRRHPGGHFLQPFMAHYDRKHFETVCYYNGTHRDDVTARFMALADGWRFCWGVSDEALAEQVRADGIDILLDAAGHLADSRLLLFARRPAPLQVSFPIYPATTGLAAMDYRVMDVHFAPPDADRTHVERLIRLPDCHVCYQPLDVAVEPVEEPPLLRNGFPTLASFNNMAKTGERTVALWARVLQRLPDARLLLKWQGLPSGERHATLERFIRHGIDPARIVLLDWAADPYTPYLDVDLCLDPVHANGGTTTCDALWMGVPVVTLAGAHPFARVGLCHLSNVGLKELVAHDADAYVDIVESVIRTPGRLAGLRRGLRARFQASPLMDAPRYADNLQSALRAIWQDWCADADPAAVEPALSRRLQGAYTDHRAGRVAAAAVAYRGTLARHPAALDALQLLGVTERQQGRPAAAVAVLRRALRLSPAYGVVRFNLALALRDLGRLPDAVAALRVRASEQPEEPETWVALGATLQRLLRTGEAESAFRRVVTLDAGHAVGWMNLAWVLLIAGRFAEGWAAFEWRWRRDDFTSPQRPFTQPRWDGSPLQGRTVLLHAEQGYGDTLQMLRYVPLVAARGGRVVLECPAPLLPLARRVPGIDLLVAGGEPLPDFAVHCPLMSLPDAFGTTLDSIPAGAPYLSAEPERRASWASRMAEPGGGRALRVGVVWAGNPTFKGDRERSPGLAALAPLFAVPGVRLFGLQMGAGRRDLAAFRMPAHFVDLGGELRDFGDSAAVMANLDLVISSCTAPAHLAGALGVPTWVLLPFAPDWRWLLEREDSPWYPSVRLFRQPAPGDWAGVVERVRQALNGLANPALGLPAAEAGAP